DQVGEEKQHSPAASGRWANAHGETWRSRLGAEGPVSAAERLNRLRDLLGENLDEEVYLNTEQARQYAGRPTRPAFIRWAKTNEVPLRKPSPKARTVVVRKSDLDLALRVPLAVRKAE